MRKRYEAGPPPTLGEVVDQGDALAATCERPTCMHRAALDVADLARRLGRAATVPDMRRRLTCTKCGGPRRGDHPHAKLAGVSMKTLLVPIGADDLALVADYAAALGLPSIEAGAARIIAEWAGRQRLKLAARKRRR